MNFFIQPGSQSRRATIKEWVGACNELNAGYAADGYARISLKISMSGKVVNSGLKKEVKFMSAHLRKRKRDIEKNYPAKQFAIKLRRLADCIEKGNRFRLQVAGERIVVPPDAIINIEHERSSSEEEIEFQIKWQLDN